MIAVVRGGDLDNWTPTNSLPVVANHFFSIRSGVINSWETGLIVGDYGATLAVSGWGPSVQPLVTSATEQTLLDSAYGGQTWVVVGRSGTIFIGATNTSSTRFSWTGVDSGTTATLTGIAYGDGRWVVVGDAGTILTSTNHLDWQAESSPTAVVLRGIAFVAGRWVAVGGDVLDGILLTSTNGLDWVAQPAPAVMHAVAGSNAGWVAVGELGVIIFSPDGLNWTAVPSGTSSTLRAVAAGSAGPGTATSWAAVGDGGTIFESENGEQWRSVPCADVEDLYGVMSAQVGSMDFSARGWAAVGANGTVLKWATSASNVPNPISGSAAPPFVRGLAAGAGKWAAVGTTGTAGTAFPTGFILLSPDALNWRLVLAKAGEGFESVGYTNGLWLTVGTNATGGLIRSSTNGADWSELHLDFPVPRLHGLAAGADRWIAVGDQGTILFAANGLDWTLVASGTTNNLQAIGYDGQRWVAVGDRGTVRISSDGLSWQSRETGVYNQLLDVTYGAGRWIAVGSQAILSSTDTATWSPVPNNYSLLGRVRYQDGLWVAWSGYPGGGTLLTSYDGVQWTAHSLLGQASMLFDLSPGLWGAFAGGRVWQSARFWVDSLSVSQQSNSQLIDISFHFGPFTAPGARIELSLFGVGQTSIVLSASNLVTSRGVGTNVETGVYHAIWNAAAALPPETYLTAATLQVTATAPGYSTTLRSATFAIDFRTFVTPWSVRQGPTNADNLVSVTYGNGQWVALGGSTVLTSPDGVSWTRQNAGVSNLVAGAGYHNGTWLALSHSDAWTSADAIHWVDWPNISSNWLWAASYGGGQWVATGANGAVLLSPNGSNWVKTSSGAGSTLDAIDYGDGLWATVGYITLLTSIDAVRWTNQPPQDWASLFAIHFGQGRWVAVGLAGTIITSTDGLNWTAVWPPVSASLWSVDYGNGLWVAVGDAGAMVSSPDGIHWTVRDSGTTANLHSVAYGNWRWAAVGDGGIILSTDTVRPAVDLTLLPPRRQSDGSLVLDGTAVPDENYRLEATTNFIDWSTVTNFVPTTNDFEFTDTQAAESPQRFYRLVSP
ncbi:MAG: hypothetical protein KGS61_15595 [Verrucomicrobia bacterium]|nr:hypothetical protein [Verrucomicrobiota bacterium]